jgi:hypothetical protein
MFFQVLKLQKILACSYSFYAIYCTRAYEKFTGMKSIYYLAISRNWVIMRNIRDMYVITAVVEIHSWGSIMAA